MTQHSIDLRSCNCARLEAEVERLREEFTVLVDACGHCLAAGLPPIQGMIDAARAALASDGKDQR